MMGALPGDVVRLVGGHLVGHPRALVAAVGTCRAWRALLAPLVPLWLGGIRCLSPPPFAASWLHATRRLEASLPAARRMLPLMPTLEDIQLHAHTDELADPEQLSAVLQSIVSTRVQLFKVQHETNLCFSLFKGSKASDNWDEPDVVGPLGTALAKFLALQPCSIKLHGYFEPAFYLRRHDGVALGFCYISFCDGFPGWLGGLFVPTTEMDKCSWVSSSSNVEETMVEKVARWDRFDSEDVWVEQTIWPKMRTRGNGEACGNAYFHCDTLRFSLRPVGLFSAEDSHRYEKAKRERHEFFLKETL